MGMNIPGELLSNARRAGESFQEFRDRRRTINYAIRRYLRHGRPATHSRDGEPYVPGPYGHLVKAQP